MLARILMCVHGTQDGTIVWFGSIEGDLNTIMKNPPRPMASDVDANKKDGQFYVYVVQAWLAGPDLDWYDIVEVSPQLDAIPPQPKPRTDLLDPRSSWPMPDDPDILRAPVFLGCQIPAILDDDPTMHTYAYHRVY